MFKVKVIKTPLQESVDEILEWLQKSENKWTEQDQKNREEENADTGFEAFAIATGLLMIGMIVLIIIIIIFV
jgi:hypothetical protein